MSKQFAAMRTAAAFLLVCVSAMAGGQLRFCLPFEPKTLEPNMAADDASETLQYLTAGVLIRTDRLTQQPQPELATSWKVAPDARSVTFELRQGVRFSDGSPLRAEDVVHTIKLLNQPDKPSPIGDSFRTADGDLTATADGGHKVTVRFPGPVAGVERLFDQLAIRSARSEKSVLGPFVVSEHHAGAFLILNRNPHYWKKDANGRQLPYLDSIRLDIQSNPELEMMRFRRSQIHLMNHIEPHHFARLERVPHVEVNDVGPSLDMEILWFNQAAGSPLPAYKKAWFESPSFRRAISFAIRRDDLCRVVYAGHAVPGLGPISPANRIWRHADLKPHPYSPDEALAMLEKAGFRKDTTGLKDHEGHAVEFSVITNAGNRARERMATMIQHDLASIGVRLNVVTLDFHSLLERVTRTFDYEACLLGFTNVDLDPNAQMNVWLSSAHQHPWNPAQKKPATVWEAEIDRLMRAQASSTEAAERKRQFDRVQEIVSEQTPILYLVHRNILVGYSRSLKNVKPSILRPQVYWNIEYLDFE